MSRAIQLHLFHRRRCVVHDEVPTRNVTIIFLHLRLETHASAELDVVFLLRPEAMYLFSAKGVFSLAAWGNAPGS